MAATKIAGTPDNALLVILFILSFLFYFFAVGVYVLCKNKRRLAQFSYLLLPIYKNTASE